MTTSLYSPSFLFVCTGNICRSPLAELAMRSEVKKRHLTLDIDSAGLGSWHTGDRPDPRARATAKKYGLNPDTLRARQVNQHDFERFTHIIALDRSHYNTLKRLQPSSSTSHITLLMQEVTDHPHQDVADPYYGSDEDFETTWHDVSKGCHALAQRILDTNEHQ